MSPILLALSRALHSLRQPGILWHLLWPSFLALGAWAVIAWLWWGDLAAWGAAQLQSISWLSWLGEGVVLAVLLILLLPLVYATAATVVATVSLPLILERVGEADYGDLEARRGGTQAGSVANALVALLKYLLAWIVTLPLLLIPGVGLLLPLLLLGYLNQRAYRYDALMQHADAEEMRGLIARRKGGLYLVGLIAGAVGYIPVVNLLAPAYAGLVFVHYCLESLRRLRQGQTQ